ncbi:hypothetical protein HUB95_05085 [Wolbachia endosymbiont of Ceratosolen solmsi]|nr:hypothetical protein HUB95_05085 [Wolbachia endosymbiont of Ceratosolen solmsi]
MHNLKSAYSKKLKIGAALKTGDCFFDSVAQGLNELKPGHRFTAKSLRKDCADYAENKKDSRWVFDEITKNIAEGYAVPMIGSNGNVMKDNQNNIIPDNIASFDRYLKDIRSMATEASLPIWGRPGIEGRMICDKYEVELDIYSIEEDSQKVTVTKITAHDDDLEVFIQGVNLDQLKIDNSKKTVGVVNYMQHFVPLLSGISEDIKEDQQVSSEAILGTGKRVPTSDQSEKEVQQEIINISTSATVYTDREIPTSNQSEQKVQQEIINTNTSAPVLQIYTDKKIPSSHQQEQKTQQKEIQKKLINSYRKEAIYVIATVITAIAFTASAIAAIITQAIPFACLAGTALVAACVCVYQLTQSHKDINELKSELGKGQEDNAHTFLEKVGLKMHDLINKAISKV